MQPACEELRSVPAKDPAAALRSLASKLRAQHAAALAAAMTGTEEPSQEPCLPRVAAAHSALAAEAAATELAVFTAAERDRQDRCAAGLAQQELREVPAQKLFCTC